MESAQPTPRRYDAMHRRDIAAGIVTPNESPVGAPDLEDEPMTEDRGVGFSEF
jgi:hypothetical protein